MRLRQLTDGTLIWPGRGKVPVCPENYAPDRGNPNIFRPIYPECLDLDVRKMDDKSCKCVRKKRFCLNSESVVTGRDCMHCDHVRLEIEEEIEEEEGLYDV